MTDYIISDLHFSHDKCWSTFTKDDGSPLRPFSSSEEMNDTIIENINKTVSTNDRLFIAGDIVINKRHIHNLSRIKCENRILIMGNHDVDWKELLPYFKRIAGCLEYAGTIITHIPVHPSQMKRYKGNIHGHLHDANVMLQHHDKDMVFKDPRYFNVSVEQINFTPINLDYVVNKLKEQFQ